MTPASLDGHLYRKKEFEEMLITSSRNDFRATEKSRVGP